MEALLNNLTNSIGWSIIHSLWQGAIIYAVLFIVLSSFPKMSARLKHNLSFGSLLLIFISFTITFLSIFEFPSTAVSKIDTHQITYQDFIQFNISSTFKTETYLPLVVSLYLLGLTIQLFVLISSYIKLKNLKRLSTLAVPTEWKNIFDLTLSQLKINKTVKFYLSPKVNVPLVIGFIKPVVLFPIALATQLDIKQVEAILIHELSHIRRNDYLINLVKTCIETLLFFNPFVWLTTKLIQIEREHACDDLVVDITGTPLTYAHALLKLELLRNKETPALSLAATGKNQHLYQRIKRITNMKTNYMNTKHLFFILSLTIATVMSLAWINPEKKAVLTIKKEISLAQIKSTAVEAKSIKNRLILKADTDTTVKKNNGVYVWYKNGVKISTYSPKKIPDSAKIFELVQKHNSPMWKNKVRKIELSAKDIAQRYNSPEWNGKLAKMQENALELQRKYESKEWKDQMAKMQEHALEIQNKYESKEWKDQMAKIQEHALEVQKKYESMEWKDQMAKIQEHALEIQKKYESKEWKDQMANMQENALAMQKKYESKEWKDKMAKLQENALAMQKKFESNEWKDKMIQIQKNALELEKKYNAQGWKKQVQEMEKLQESSEYKELRKKYESDLEELKKAKGIKDDKAA